MRRINWKMIWGAGPKRALPIEKPSQRIARRERAVKLRTKTPVATAACTANRAYRLICDRCVMAGRVTFADARANFSALVDGVTEVSDAMARVTLRSFADPLPAEALSAELLSRLTIPSRTPGVDASDAEVLPGGRLPPRIPPVPGPVLPGEAEPPVPEEPPQAPADGSASGQTCPEDL